MPETDRRGRMSELFLLRESEFSYLCRSVKSLIFKSTRPVLDGCGSSGREGEQSSRNASPEIVFGAGEVAKGVPQDFHRSEQVVRRLEQSRQDVTGEPFSCRLSFSPLSSVNTDVSACGYSHLRLIAKGCFPAGSSSVSIGRISVRYALRPSR